MKHILFHFLTIIVVGTSFGLPPVHRIWGGEIAAPNQFPFAASLNYPEQFCDASIINKNWLLTTAFCVDSINPNATVLVGTNSQANGGVKYNISKTIKHEEYNDTTAQNDIGLIQIDGEFEFGENIQPIEIGDAEVNETCTLIGWGATEISSFPDELRYLDLRALSLEECKIKATEIDQFYLGPEQVCTLGPEGTGACFGDAGGSLICGGNLAGVISYGISICARGYPDVHTRVSFYNDWINQNVK